MIIGFACPHQSSAMCSRINNPKGGIIKFCDVHRKCGGSLSPMVGIESSHKNRKKEL